MNITFECADKINGKVTASIVKADYEEKVNKTLKSYRQKANIPGFRPGKAPMGLIAREYGAAVKVDEINRLLSESVDKYIHDNKIEILGSPIPQEQEKLDFAKDEDFTIVFDVAVAPEFNIELTSKDKVNYYNITIDDELINQQIDVYTSKMGQYAKAKTYKDGDMLKADLCELENGSAKDNGVIVEGAILMPKYFKNKEQKALFKSCKPGDVITFNPFTAYDGNETELMSFLKITKEQAAEMKSDFTCQISEITRYEKAKLNQELFDNIYGKDVVKSEEEFRVKVTEALKTQMASDSDYRFIIDLRAFCEKKVGKLVFPDDLMKKMMLRNNPEKDIKFIEENYDGSIKELTWHLIREKLVAANNLKIEEADILAAAKETTRAQFAQYGMNNIPDEMLENYAKEMMKKEDNINGLVDRSIDKKLTECIKGIVTLTKKDISLKEFNKLFETK